MGACGGCALPGAAGHPAELSQGLRSQVPRTWQNACRSRRQELEVPRRGCPTPGAVSRAALGQVSRGSQGDNARGHTWILKILPVNEQIALTVSRLAIMIIDFNSSSSFLSFLREPSASTTGGAWLNKRYGDVRSCRAGQRWGFVARAAAPGPEPSAPPAPPVSMPGWPRGKQGSGGGNLHVWGCAGQAGGHGAMAPRPGGWHSGCPLAARGPSHGGSPPGHRPRSRAPAQRGVSGVSPGEEGGRPARPGLRCL